MVLKFKNWDKYNKRQKDIRRPLWFAMSNEIFLDPVFSELADQERLAFLWLLCEASRQNKYGEVQVSERLFCQITGYKHSTLVSTVDKLLKSGVTAGSRQDAGGNATATRQYSTVQNTLSDPDGSDQAEPGSGEEGFNLESIYQEYPRRPGSMNKGKGLARLARIVKNRADYDLAMKAVQAYKAHLVTQGKTNTEFVKMFSSFWDSQGDWKEWATRNPSEGEFDMNAFIESTTKGTT